MNKILKAKAFLVMFLIILLSLSGCDRIGEFVARDALAKARTDLQELKDENAALKARIEMFERGEAGDNDGQAAAFRRMLK
ncbi:MAG: hypothetical protein JJT87_13740 [Halomonas sp.]|nr:hypothetical protein [Halomonas sp.]